MWTILATSSPESPVGLAGEGLDGGVRTSSPEAWNPQPLGSGVLRWPLSRHPHLQLMPESMQLYTCVHAKWLQSHLTVQPSRW